MKLWKWILIGVGIACVLAIAVPMCVSAASGGDALAGLKEFYTFLIQLAQVGLQGFIEFLNAIP